MITKYHIPPPEEDYETGRFVSTASHCKHDTVILTYKRCVGGTIQYVYQCLICGNGGNALSHAQFSEEEKCNAKEFDPNMAQRIYEQERKEWKEGRIFHGPAWWDWYNRYLDSPEWQGKCTLVMLRAGGLCEACGLDPADHVHHLPNAHYGAEPLFELVAVCQSCHWDIHGRKF